MSSSIPILVFGGSGRMGRAILQEAVDQADLQIMGALVEEAPEKALPAGPALFTGAHQMIGILQF